MRRPPEKQVDPATGPGIGEGVQVEHDVLEALADRLCLAITASELHGSLCGFLAGGGKAAGASLLGQLQFDADGAEPSPADQALLADLAEGCAVALADPELGFEPLLPADDRPLAERADATLEWCRGFLGGFGLTGASSHAQLSEEAREMLRDLGAIAGSSFDYGDASEDEDALIEVHEFMRVGAMLLHAECSGPVTHVSGTIH
ncbi:MAG: UPF0149 family protein [Rhodanobacter sp.]